MALNKKGISNILYWLAVLFSYGNLIAIIAIQWEFIISGKGIGSFTTLWFVGYFAISFIAWLIAFLVTKNRNFNIAYWLSIAIPIVMFLTLPIKFYIE
tara:strand:- start:331 stop:624 length:294 start_codon:yes stop_codon:yes gene_type:complete